MSAHDRLDHSVDDLDARFMEAVDRIRHDPEKMRLAAERIHALLAEQQREPATPKQPIDFVCYRAQHLELCEREPEQCTIACPFDKTRRPAHGSRGGPATERRLLTGAEYRQRSREDEKRHGSPFYRYRGFTIIRSLDGRFKAIHDDSRRGRKFFATLAEARARVDEWIDGSK